MKKDILSILIDRLFAIKKTSLFLIGILVLAFILRLIAAINLTVGADDMHHTLHAINFFSSGRLITYDQSAGLWHAFTSVIYDFLGVNQLTSRIAALLFGSFSILIVYLLTREFFDEKVSLIAAFLLAIAPFHIKSTVGEMDVMAMFFVLLGMFFFIRSTKEGKLIYFSLSGLFIGLAIYTKVYPILFIPSLLLYFIYVNHKKNIIKKDNLKKIIIFLLFIFIFTIPALTHNYLLLKDKGFLDLQFTRTFGVGKDISAQYYSWDFQFIAKNDWKGLILGNSVHNQTGRPLLQVVLQAIFWGDPVNSIFAVLGIIFILFNRKKYKDYLIFFIFSILFVLPFLASIIPLPKHFLFAEILMIPMGSLFLSSLNNKLSNLSGMKIDKFILIAILIISLILLGMPLENIGTLHFYGKSHIAQMIEFKNANIPENALIVGDSRMYRGRIHWTFYGRPYLEASDFISIINSKEQLPGENAAIDIYFFECVIDDCGWGTVKDQPEFNSSMESLVDLFKQNGQLVKEIKEPVEEKAFYPIISSEKQSIINVYNLKLELKDSVLLIANQPREWFLYTIGYQPPEKQFDYYETNNLLDKLLNKIAHWIVFVALVLSFLSPLYVIYLLNKK